MNSVRILKGKWMTDSTIDWFEIYEKQIKKHLDFYAKPHQANPPFCFPALREQQLRVAKRREAPPQKRLESVPYYLVTVPGFSITFFVGILTDIP